MKEVKVLMFRRLMFLVGMASLAAVTDSNATEPQERVRVVQALQNSLQEAERYAFDYSNRESTKPKLQSKPILRWSNPVVGTIYGNVFVWTKHGRPEVVASIYRFFEPYVEFSAEFHSLSRQPFTGSRDGQTVWTSSKAGVKYKRLTGAPNVATTRLGRLRQMRALVQEFRAVQTDIESVKRNLRLLPQPAFRYAEVADDRQLDGAMFAFVLGTDPEVFLLLETRDGQWHFGLTRMCRTYTEPLPNLP